MGILVAISSSSGAPAAEALERQVKILGEELCATGKPASVRNKAGRAVSSPRLHGSGAQIASDPDSGIWLAVVGSCFHSSCDSNAASLLRQYIRQTNDEFYQSLEGFFSLIIADQRSGELLVVTDIIGSCHMYVRGISGASVVSNSSLLLSALAAAAPDPVACQEFLGMGILYENRSLYHGIGKLPPASEIRFKDGVEVGRRTYWTPAQLTPESLRPKEAVESLWSNATAAAGKIGRQYTTVVCDLTGGYDSRAMVAAFLGAGCVIATTVSGPADSRDVLVSSALAQRLGLAHQHFPPGALPSFDELQRAVKFTDGEYDVVEYAGIARIHTQLAQRFQVSINGSFGEVARGYWWELLVPRVGARQAVDAKMLSERRYAWNSSNDLFQKDHQLDLVEHMAGVVRRSTSDLEGSPNTFQMDVAYLRMRMQRWQGRIASSTDRIWPCLSPFMFRSTLETMLQAPFAIRQRSLLVRRMLAAYQPELANFPLEHGYPAAPMTARNFWRFWPVVPEYVGAAMRKLRRLSGSISIPEGQTLCEQLWKLDGVRECFETPNLESHAVLEPAALGSFLEASRKPGFTRCAEWTRLLSLEMALRASRQIRKKASF